MPMTNPVPPQAAKPAAAGFMPRVKGLVSGIIADFWKDGPYRPSPFEQKILRKIPLLAKLAGGMAQPGAAAPAPASAARMAAVARKAELPRWRAETGEVAEKMWGKGYVLPPGEAVTDLILTPLELKPEMKLLDLSAGLGGLTRKAAGLFKCAVTGLEADPQIAARGMALSVEAGKGKEVPIATFDPEELSVTDSYDAVIAQEFFYRVADKNKLVAAIAACVKPEGQIAFTDYILDAENKAKSAITAWMTHEAGAVPLGLIETAEIWAKAGFTLKINEDQTSFYRGQIMAGLKRFVKFLGENARPDADTKKLILDDIELWLRRMAAIEQGLKFYRFHGVKG